MESIDEFTKDMNEYMRLKQTTERIGFLENTMQREHAMHPKKEKMETRCSSLPHLIKRYG